MSSKKQFDECSTSSSNNRSDTGRKKVKNLFSNLAVLLQDKAKIENDYFCLKMEHITMLEEMQQVIRRQAYEKNSLIQKVEDLCGKLGEANEKICQLEEIAGEKNGGQTNNDENESKFTDCMDRGRKTCFITEELEEIDCNLKENENEKLSCELAKIQQELCNEKNERRCFEEKLLDEIKSLQTQLLASNNNNNQYSTDEFIAGRNKSNCKQQKNLKHKMMDFLCTTNNMTHNQECQTSPILQNSRQEQCATVDFTNDKICGGDNKKEKVSCKCGTREEENIIEHLPQTISCACAGFKIPEECCKIVAEQCSKQKEVKEKSSKGDVQETDKKKVKKTGKAKKPKKKTK